MKFRLLKANEIDCRISTVKANGISLLLYKDARVDQNILDETVGAMNWQRSHSRDNANCTVSIWDDEKKQWVSKEDTGKESYSEAEKGLASDSFKRACFNWGIGRELYSAPFIWISSDKCEITNGKCFDKFSVSKIAYDSERNISQLVIINDKTKKTVYSMGKDTPEQKATPEADKVSTTTMGYIKIEMLRTGVDADVIAKRYKVSSLNELTQEQAEKALASLKKSKDKAK